MWKYTKYNGEIETFETEDEIEEYIRKNDLFLFDESDIEEYVDKKYSAHELLGLMRDAINARDGWNGGERVASALENTYYGIREEAESDAWDDRCNGIGPAEGSDWKFDEEVFIWVDDSEEDE